MNEIVFGLIAILMSAASPRATILFAGDAMQHQAQINAAHTAGRYDYSGYFDSIKEYVTGADFAVVNLETPLGGKPYKGYPCFSSPDEYAHELHKAGFDLFLTANNHTLDCRAKGLKRTIDTLDGMGIDHIGTYKNQASRDSLISYIAEINGFKIGFLNYTYGTNGIPATDGVVVNMIDTVQIKKDIERIRDDGAEMVTVATHWGTEYVLLPNKSQKNIADFLADQGVDMIIGGHPHVIQPMELKWNEKNQKKYVLVYSLGNFVSNMKTTDTRGGALTKITVERDSTGIPRVKDAKYSLVFTEQPDSYRRNFRVVPVEKVSPVWKTRALMFEKNAEKIFNTHNRNVPRDTI